jgi:hypothetical protein
MPPYGSAIGIEMKIYRVNFYHWKQYSKENSFFPKQYTYMQAMGKCCVSYRESSIKINEMKNSCILQCCDKNQ